MHILHTDRLIIREARLTDADFFLDLLNSPNWKTKLETRPPTRHYDRRKPKVSEPIGETGFS